MATTKMATARREMAPHQDTTMAKMATGNNDNDDGASAMGDGATGDGMTGNGTTGDGATGDDDDDCDGRRRAFEYGFI